ncbi:uncharacterized protein FA14DRAFT_162420 [Meira miltonrushii]|uniref:Cwf19-like C-terminal domain-containing protein n=1 Tax=Meira miltonrushii TaxID=1280837 RepID=A0A316V431_9BASI|nr:uncharacterized protein FA14DRAFT_162420 [Meira miltonrushii]PWN32212.1 hypothetical protein FA14DRAFT_162420 [Meira miltonrushii]
MVVQDGKPVKVLTVGPACGRIGELIGKITAINTKYGPFDALLVLGDLFRPYSEGDELSEEEIGLLNGTLPSPIPIYFAHQPSPIHPIIQAAIIEKGCLNNTTSASSDEQAIKLNESLYFLGKEGIVNVPNSKGLRVAVLGGCYDHQRWQDSIGVEESVEEGLKSPFISSTSVERLLSYPSFQQPSVLADVAQDEGEPTTLAAARAQMAKRTDILQKQSEATRKPPIDILLTNAWPSNITMFSNPEKFPNPTSRVWGAPILAKLISYGQPRYHFALAPGSCGSPESEDAFGIVGLDGTEEGTQLRKIGAFWEREPFRNQSPSHPLCNVTRFISLARFANEKKERWFMALNLVPASNADKAVPNKEPAGTTLNPFSLGESSTSTSRPCDKAKRKEIEDDMQSGQNYRWAENGKARPKKQQRSDRQNGASNAAGLPNKPKGPLPDKPTKIFPVGPEDCWFCLSNPQCAKHLIVAIGTECYVAMPKGQLPISTKDRSTVPGGGHVLIVPIEHIPSVLGHPDPAVARPIADEMNAWRTALRKAYSSCDATMVSWEICRTVGSRAGHMQCQAVPIPSKLCKNGALEAYFRQAAKKYGYEMIENTSEVQQLLKISDDVSQRRKQADYFRLDLDDKTWLMLLPQGLRFYLQFPRETLANFLGFPDRADWKKCANSDEIETEETQAFKGIFDSYAESVIEE